MKNKKLYILLILFVFLFTFASCKDKVKELEIPNKPEEKIQKQTEENEDTKDNSQADKLDQKDAQEAENSKKADEIEKTAQEEANKKTDEETKKGTQEVADNETEKKSKEDSIEANKESEEDTKKETQETADEKSNEEDQTNQQANGSLAFNDASTAKLKESIQRLGASFLNGVNEKYDINKLEAISEFEKADSYGWICKYDDNKIGIAEIPLEDGSDAKITVWLWDQNTLFQGGSSGITNNSPEEFKLAAQKISEFFFDNNSTVNHLFN